MSEPYAPPAADRALQGPGRRPALQRALLRAAAALLGLCALHGQAQTLAPTPAQTAAQTPAQTARPIDLQGHRGARWVLPENSLASFAHALKAGVTTLELDVGVTRDGVMVVHHDRALNPDITRDAQGRFIDAPPPLLLDLTWQQVQALDIGQIRPGTNYARNFASQQRVDGTRIPRLSDLFRLVRDSGNTRVKFAIETKLSPLHPAEAPEPEAFVRQLMQEVREAGMLDRVQILSFDWRTLRIVQRDFPTVPTVCLTAQLPALDTVMARSAEESPWNAGFTLRRHGSIPRMAKAAGCTHWSSFFRELSADNVKEAQSLGLKVLAWTVNDRATLERMLDLGVDGLVTDHPELGAEVLRGRGLRW